MCRAFRSTSNILFSFFIFSKYFRQLNTTYVMSLLGCRFYHTRTRIPITLDCPTNRHDQRVWDFPWVYIGRGLAGGLRSEMKWNELSIYSFASDTHLRILSFRKRLSQYHNSKTYSRKKYYSDEHRESKLRGRICFSSLRLNYASVETSVYKSIWINNHLGTGSDNWKHILAHSRERALDHYVWHVFHVLLMRSRGENEHIKFKSIN